MTRAEGVVEDAMQADVESAADLGAADTAWKRVAPLYGAAARAPAGGAAGGTIELAASRAVGTSVLQARHLGFTHRGRREPVLRNASVELRAGERVLLEGPSGGGKSTLAALLAGLRRPDEGLVLAAGLDLPTLGFDRWRQRVVLAPQFHENHIVTETLAFNLLLGTRWPPRAGDLLEVGVLMEELGLGPLLASMPAGLQQMVGEGGWQLSHGERSRIYLARALLQGADVVILDESFGALDASSLREAMTCARRRAGTLVDISHE